MDSLTKSAFGDHLAELSLSSEAQLVVGEMTDAGIAAVMTSPARQDAVAGVLATFAAASQASVLHGAPGQWLVITKSPPAPWIADLAEALGSGAQVFDQSAGYALLTLRGGCARALLQKGLFIDLDKALDRDGTSVTGVIAHVSVSVWRIAPDLFGVAVPRSYAGSFWHWFEAVTAAEAIQPGWAG